MSEDSDGANAPKPKRRPGRPKKEIVAAKLRSADGKFEMSPETLTRQSAPVGYVSEKKLKRLAKVTDFTAIERFREEKPDFRNVDERIRFIIRLMGRDEWITGISSLQLSQESGVNVETIANAAKMASKAVKILLDPETTKQLVALEIFDHFDQAKELRNKQAAAMEAARDFKERGAAAQSYRETAAVVDRAIDRLGRISGLMEPTARTMQAQVNIIYTAKGELQPEVAQLIEKFVDCLGTDCQCRDRVMKAFGSGEARNAVDAEFEVVSDDSGSEGGLED